MIGLVRVQLIGSWETVGQMLHKVMYNWIKDIMNKYYLSNKLINDVFNKINKNEYTNKWINDCHSIEHNELSTGKFSHFLIRSS